MTDDGDRQPGYPNLHRGPHPDPEVEERRKRGLRRGNRKHGVYAYADAMRLDLEGEHREQLRGRYPGAAATALGNDLIVNMACRRAQRDLYAAFVADSGPVHLRGRAEVQAPARELLRCLADDERAVVQLAEIEREAGRGAGEAELEIRRARGELPRAAEDADGVDEEREQ
jgi:hypothetical protein